jgi:hypothetical protein
MDIEEGNDQGCILFGIQIDPALAISFMPTKAYKRDPGRSSKKRTQRCVGVCIANL